jgi:hypothetical protein
MKPRQRQQILEMRDGIIGVRSLRHGLRQFPLDAGTGNTTMMAKTINGRKAGPLLHFSLVR